MGSSKATLMAIHWEHRLGAQPDISMANRWEQSSGSRAATLMANHWEQSSGPQTAGSMANHWEQSSGAQKATSMVNRCEQRSGSHGRTGVLRGAFVDGWWRKGHGPTGAEGAATSGARPVAAGWLAQTMQLSMQTRWMTAGLQADGRRESRHRQEGGEGPRANGRGGHSCQLECG